jgi:UDP-N-acetylmuramyl pentapeptide synthase
LCGDENTVVRTITSDSRETGEDCCYIAIVGDNFDGHTFIEPLLLRGAVKAFLTLRPEDEALARRYNVAAILTTDNVRALGHAGCGASRAVQPPAGRRNRHQWQDNYQGNDTCSVVDALEHSEKYQKLQ